MKPHDSETRWRAWRAMAMVLVWAMAASAMAAGGAGGGMGLGSGVASAEYQQAVAAIKAEHWQEAIALLEPYVKQARNDADGHNWLAYAYRKSGQLEPAFAHYRRALQINPTHLGAHEYMGEAYLQAGQPDQAEAHLRELARICAARCEEYADLKQAITGYRTRLAAAPAKP
jgi:tetratricopeptide (TPR) repeat protein